MYSIEPLCCQYPFDRTHSHLLDRVPAKKRNQLDREPTLLFDRTDLGARFTRSTIVRSRSSVFDFDSLPDDAVSEPISDLPCYMARFGEVPLLRAILVSFSASTLSLLFSLHFLSLCFEYNGGIVRFGLGRLCIHIRVCILCFICISVITFIAFQFALLFI